MFNFKRLSSAQKPEAPASLGELFSQLDRKATHTSLRPIQVSALEALDKQASERDVVIKLSTGSGKTLVGLVYAVRIPEPIDHPLQSLVTINSSQS